MDEGLGTSDGVQSRLIGLHGFTAWVFYGLCGCGAEIPPFFLYGGGSASLAFEEHTYMGRS